MGEDLRLDYKSQKSLSGLGISEKQSKRTLTTEMNSKKYFDAKIEKLNSSIRVKAPLGEHLTSKDNNMFKKKRMGSQRGSVSQRSQNRSINSDDKLKKPRKKNAYDL